MGAVVSGGSSSSSGSSYGSGSNSTPDPSNVCADMCQLYVPPIGRLPVLGRVRAEIDRLRISAALDINKIEAQTIKAQDDRFKVTAEVPALIKQTKLAVIDRSIKKTKDSADIEALLSKSNAEITLLMQKAATELAQVSDYIPWGLGKYSGTVSGVVKKQKDLFKKQTDGFDRDAEQKLAKIMADSWAVRQTTDGGAVVDSNGLDDSSIHDVIDKAKSGINA